jgi:hypothetical protein
LILADEIDATRVKDIDLYLFLDKYFLRNEYLTPTTEEVVKDFGVNSPAFTLAFGELSRIWKEVRGRSDYYILYENWKKYLSIAYGSNIVGEELFLRHTYLASLAKILVSGIFSERKGISFADLERVFKGEFSAVSALIII